MIQSLCMGNGNIFKSFRTPGMRDYIMKTDTTQDLRTRILDEAARQFDKKGIKFTMDDLAHALGMSKKTIYTVFEDKKQIMTDTIDRFFEDAFIEEQMILSDDTIGVVEQLRRIIGKVPDRYIQNDLTQLYVLKEKYPSVYRHWKHCREDYWKGVEVLLKKGIEEHLIRPISLPILKTMFQSTVEQFFQKDVLVKNHISYREALDEVASILVTGIINR